MSDRPVLSCSASERSACPEEPGFRRSARRSRARRGRAWRRLRWSRRRRGAGAILLAAMTLAAGGAAAQEAGARATSSAGAALHQGSSGPQVVALQRALGVAADGRFGPATRRAVRRFQRRHGLRPDGVAGPATLRALGLGRVASAPAAAPGGVLARIAQCESGGNPAAVSASGRYRGKYQFDLATWRRMGGAGDPAQASEAEQDRIAAALYAQAGTAPWPNCA